MARLLSNYHKLSPQLQDLALSTYGLLLRQLRYGKAFHQTLADLEAGKTDPFLDQSERLQELVAAALQQTEHYGKLLGDQSFTISEGGLQL